MTAAQPGADAEPITLALPFHGLWLVQNSPARRVPSHGTDLLGERYAIDFVGVDARRRTAEHSGWGALVGTEPPEMFFSFGRPILAPCDGTVVARHDGEPDHEARRSPLTLVPYLLGQRDRLQQGVAAIAGNHVILRLDDRDAYVGLVHLKRHSFRVDVGDRVTVGHQLAECGNSGNSTQPHLHVQAMDSADLSVARGIPILFRDFSEQSHRTSGFRSRDSGVPGEGSVVESTAARQD
ncbi:M23 family metallopeptidase [Mycetocola zhujimingii]|uniref:M23 family metallopeptidase n=1 Tax=Mycetocola zhujimingii TaxID=2079792 RepID=UPI000D37AB55|nr:M23 family metallopeptidase [Mycetocola zhujimingii]AWB86225.1 peptidase M23 [Mycetocola zhujimingii]